MSFKKIIRFIVGHDLNKQQQTLSKMEDRQQMRRLLNLGVLGHQLAVKAICIMTKDQYEEVADEFSQQKRA